MNIKKPFSPGTIAGEHLTLVTPEVRNAIMDDSGIHEEANKENEERSNTKDAIEQVLSTKDEVNVGKVEIDKDKVVLSEVFNRYINTTFGKETIEFKSEVLEKVLNNYYISSLCSVEQKDNFSLVVAFNNSLIGDSDDVEFLIDNNSFLKITNTTNEIERNALQKKIEALRLHIQKYFELKGISTDHYLLRGDGTICKTNFHPKTYNFSLSVIEQVLSTKDEDKVGEAKINSILKLNHPIKQQFYDFVTSSEENKDWYLNNIDNIKLVDDGIEILGDIFCLEDETAPDGDVIWNSRGHTYFNYYSAQKHAKDSGKRIPEDWGKYIKILPGDDINKLKFLTKVLGLSFAGYRGASGNYDLQSKYAMYMSSIPYNLVFGNDNISINASTSYSLENGFALRCLKN